MRRDKQPSLQSQISDSMRLDLPNENAEARGIIVKHLAQLRAMQIPGSPRIMIGNTNYQSDSGAYSEIVFDWCYVETLLRKNGLATTLSRLKISALVNLETLAGTCEYSFPASPDFSNIEFSFHSSNDIGWLSAIIKLWDAA